MTAFWAIYTPYAFILPWAIVAAALAVMLGNLLFPWDKYRPSGTRQTRLMFTPSPALPMGDERALALQHSRSTFTGGGELPAWCNRVSWVLFGVLCVIALLGLINLGLNIAYVTQHAGSVAIRKSAAANIVPAVIAFAMRKTWTPG